MRRAGMKLLSAVEAKRVDEELMGPVCGFRLEQLMELAGLSVACAARRLFPPESFGRPLLLCGKGNNGGDGLVAARHLYHFGYRPLLVCSASEGADTDKGAAEDFQGALLRQLHSLEVPCRGVQEPPLLQELDGCSFVVDAIFGFGFHGSVRQPWRDIIESVNECGKPVLSVDVPSGWHVEDGYQPGEGIVSPHAVISLTAPKLCMRGFAGRHFVGGRFVPPSLASEFDFEVPEYPGDEQVVEVPLVHGEHEYEEEEKEEKEKE